MICAPLWILYVRYDHICPREKTPFISMCSEARDTPLIRLCAIGCYPQIATRKRKKWTHIKLQAVSGTNTLLGFAYSSAFYVLTEQESFISMHSVFFKE